MLEHLCEHLCSKPLLWTLLLEVVERELELRDRLLHLLVEHGLEDRVGRPRATAGHQAPKS